MIGNHRIDRTDPEQWKLCDASKWDPVSTVAHLMAPRKCRIWENKEKTSGVVDYKGL